MAARRARSAIVIGGGFYGCALALHLDREGFAVTLFEREDELLTRASLVNQARLHNGYHYPRSFQTAIRSRANLPAFREIYAEAVDDSFEALYAVARNGSKISTRHFQRFCAAANMPLKPASKSATALFDARLIEAVFVVDEPAFNAQILRQRLLAALKESGVALHLGAAVAAIRNAPSGEGVTVTLTDGGEAAADWGFNCTYAALNHLARRGADADPAIAEDAFALKHQISEIALLEPTSELAERGVTIMDGPFFSVMPFPARGLHSLTHVRYTHHFGWLEQDPGAAARNPLDILDDYLAQGGGARARSRYSWMIRDARRYLPCLAEARHIDSLFEVKTLINETAFDDARPILFQRHRATPRLVSILGGKIDNIFDILEYVDMELALRGRILPLHG